MGRHVHVTWCATSGHAHMREVFNAGEMNAPVVPEGGYVLVAPGVHFAPDAIISLKYESYEAKP